MEPFYPLWDVETGTSLGTYATEDEALSVVAMLLEANGEAYADALSLGRDDPKGAAESIAIGDALRERVRTWQDKRLAAVEATD